jgi:GNAT superfamily N-acetyltransferase
MDEITVRAAEAADAGALAASFVRTCAAYARLDPALFQVPDLAAATERVAALLGRARAADELWLVAEVEGRVAGDVRASLERPDAHAATQLQRDLGRSRVAVHALNVDEAWRRRGVASRLMGALEGWAAAAGAEVVTLDTWAGSPLSPPFYERLGYRRQAIVFRKALGS